jgi:hypothetical protein
MARGRCDEDEGAENGEKVPEAVDLAARASTQTATAAIQAELADQSS